MPNHIPKGYHAITPYLLLEDPDGFIEFAKSGLGAEIGGLHHNDDGRLMHGELFLLGCVLELGQPQSAYPSRPMNFHVFVEDPDAAYDRAIEHGATSLYEVSDMPYGERSGGVQDPFGNQWYFACVIDAEARAN